MSASPQPTTADIVTALFNSLSLPPPPPYTVLPSSTPLPLPSSYNLPLLVTSTTLLSSLLPSLILAHRNSLPSAPATILSPLHATAQYQSERIYTLTTPLPPLPPPIGGLHRTGGGGHIRMHDSFPHHRLGALTLLGLPASASVSRADVSAACLRQPSALALEAKAHSAGLPIYALRSPEEWAEHPQSAHTSSDPIILTSLSSPSASHAPLPLPPTLPPFRCLSGLRVLDLSRVIAAPSAGKLLASHGADVLWITSPNLPALPHLDIEFSRGKRSIQLDLSGASPADTATLLRLVRDCDVFLQAYRPGGLAGKGFGQDDLLAANPDLICANLSAFGSEGPWAGRRGFDSLVQTCTGMNVSEAASARRGSSSSSSSSSVPALPLPCQALDHASGHLLAAGILAAVYHRSTKGGPWRVEVSLAATQKFLDSMGRLEDGFACEAVTGPESFPEEVFEKGETPNNGTMRYVGAAGKIEGVEVGWDKMPSRIGGDKAEWLSR